MISLGIVGSRTIDDYEWIKSVLDQHFINVVSLVVSGGAAGVDTLGVRWATENEIPILVHRPDYKTYGSPRALFERNSLIVRDSDIIVAFWDGISTGTKDTINKAKKDGKSVMIVHPSNKMSQLGL